jgi:type II secretory pathway pseudopilin PulG
MRLATINITSGRGRRSGLTLVELLVVLMILIAVAGIIVPLVPNMLNRAQEASDSTQVNELAKAIKGYQAAYAGYPDGFDLLTDGTSITFPAYLPVDPVNGLTFGGYAVPGNLTPSELTALFNAGIQHVQPLAPAPYTSAPPTLPFHATLNPYPVNSTVTSNSTPTLNATSLIFAIIFR